MEEVYNKVYMLSSGLQVPVRMLRYGQCTFIDPEASHTLAEVLELDDWTGGIIPAMDQQGVAQFLTNVFGERFIYLMPEPGIGVWIGPMLSRIMSEHSVVEFIRKHRFPIRHRSAILEHFARLQVISENRFYHIGKLAETVLSMRSENEPSTSANEDLHPVFSVRKGTNDSSSLFEHPPYFMELKMVRLVTSGDMESALNMMNHINTFNRAVLAKDPVRSLKNSLICDCTFFARAAIAGGVSPDEAFAASDRLILEIEDSYTIPQLEMLECQHLIEFVGLVHQHNTSYYSKPVRDVISYLHSHLGEPLSLARLAPVARLHKNYLPALFKKETGVTLMQYVLRQRIEEAKFFLRYTDDSILDIALFYQFSSQSHFIQRFSRIVGMTPLQYRLHSDSRYSEQDLPYTIHLNSGKPTAKS